MKPREGDQCPHHAGPRPQEGVRSWGSQEEAEKENSGRDPLFSSDKTYFQCFLLPGSAPICCAVKTACGEPANASHTSIFHLWSVSGSWSGCTGWGSIFLTSRSQGPTHVLSSVLSDVRPPRGLQPRGAGIPSRGRNFLSLERRAVWQDELESKATSKEAAAVTVVSAAREPVGAWVSTRRLQQAWGRFIVSIHEGSWDRFTVYV